MRNRDIAPPSQNARITDLTIEESRDSGGFSVGLDLNQEVSPVWQCSFRETVQNAVTEADPKFRGKDRVTIYGLAIDDIEQAIEAAKAAVGPAREAALAAQEEWKRERTKLAELRQQFANYKFE